MVVLTDGQWNTPPSLAAVSGSINASTYAVGLGLPSNISVPALTTLCQGHNGYLLITGAFTPDQSMRLSKYFLQILAGVSNSQVAADPSGILDSSSEHRIPFWICEADFGMDLIVLSSNPYAIDFQLEAPDGSRIDPTSGAAGANAQYVLTNRVGYYRCALPVLPGRPNGSHAGRWHAVLKLAKKNPGPFIYDRQIRATSHGLVLPYEFVAHTYSTLTFAANVLQTSFEPGAVADLSASLLEYAALPTGRATVWAEVQKPGASGIEAISLAPGAGDRYVASYPMPVPGLYIFRVRARGETMYGQPFEREQTLTAVAVPGGDHWSPNDPPRDVLCEVLDCLRRTGAINADLLRRFEAMGLNLGALLKCLGKDCQTTDERPQRGRG
jgi:hypothetical protein